MKTLISLLVCFLFVIPVKAQESNALLFEQQLENAAELEETETEDDSYILRLERFKKHPLNLNSCTADDLKELHLLSDPQIDHLLTYRRLLGKLLHTYELQAVPGWDSSTIQRMLPYIQIGGIDASLKGWRHRFNGSHQWLFRYAQVLEKSKGFNKPVAGNTAYYPGSPAKFFFRYLYNYNNLLQWGVTGDKDAGEPFLKGNQRYGFDFYSFHLFVRNTGLIKTVALGDFTVNMGQGLLQWQSLAFKKSAGAMMIKRQAPVIRPYHSSGEYQFHRGVALTLQKKNWEITGFASSRRLSARVAADTASGKAFVSSILTSGYHRTNSENDARHLLKQTAVGAVLNYYFNRGRVGVNFIHHYFSHPIRFASEPYRLFAFRGSSLMNASIDYGFTHRNFHFFGETAFDHQYNKAMVHGILLSAAGSADLSLLYRQADREYQSMNANGFTENISPVNEQGLYVGLSLKPFQKIRLEMYADLFRFPWLKYRVDGPSEGKEFLVQCTYVPDKQLEMYLRYRTDAKQRNISNEMNINQIIADFPRQNMRWQTSWRINKAVLLRSRAELLWFNKLGIGAEEGFLAYVDGFYQFPHSKLEWNVRWQFVDTDGYNSRVYAYENDVLYSYSIPAFYDKGIRYYLNCKASWQFKGKEPLRHGTVIQCWLRWSQSIYQKKSSVGAGLDEIPGNKKSEIKLQCLVTF